eukprot:gb/GECG01001556.1/.p1 GENE.gb/GECG01001556.1/~~gb/GECG01001556.1/.p1  ORF type:complete len:231 (+),score=13.41 gb/GECG01001556.1/:1-693(+)
MRRSMYSCMTLFMVYLFGLLAQFQLGILTNTPPYIQIRMTLPYMRGVFLLRRGTQQVRCFGKLSHVNEADPRHPQMVDVSEKQATTRSATARGLVRLPEEVVKELRQYHSHKQGNDTDWLLSSKGPVISTAIVAGVQGAKQTPSLIPFCHSVNMTNCSVDIRFLEQSSDLEVLCTALAKDYTGVEMEALTGVSIASLTIYDMLKSLSKAICIHSIELTEKHGGKSGTYVK